MFASHRFIQKVKRAVILFSPRQKDATQPLLFLAKRDVLEKSFGVEREYKYGVRPAEQIIISVRQALSVDYSVFLILLFASLAVSLLVPAEIFYKSCRLLILPRFFCKSINLLQLPAVIFVQMLLFVGSAVCLQAHQFFACFRIIFARFEMFFYLNHDRSPTPILVVLTSDGLHFLRAVDIARLFGYKNLHKFAAMHASLRVKDIVYKRMDLSFFSVEEAIELLKKCKRTVARYLTFVMENAGVARVLPLDPIRATASHKKTPRIKFMVERYGNSQTFEELFMMQFKYQAFHLYEDLAREYM